MVEKSTKRALRRHHLARVKRARRFYFCGDLSLEGNAVGKLAHTATPCSCFMCGNPRRYFLELTIQERRLFQNVDED
ncbi:hypothetical protein [Caballeronia grimmiae]|uniref:Uncharacterized protein n=1 Tax=Caballeronia grimmiae TaxID=1071679 RepID=A0A069NPT1_9BURK|nr:hypothetical protein [Caballeronia grimmiae]KDR30473.1 hypothetical protein BG57_14475 [Caballeronia grimmiae]GGD74627.1 hypothetical protein GCM10010985_31380 [Caballeronia grimmiae]